MASRDPMEQLFGLKGERVISEFMCAKKRRRGGQLLYHGRLYISQNYLAWRAKTITGATKDVVLHFGDLVHLSRSRHGLVNPAIRLIARQKRYLFTSFFPFTMRDHALTILSGQWALYNAAAVLQRGFRKHLVRAGRGKLVRKMPPKLLFKPGRALDSAAGLQRFGSTTESTLDFGGGSSSGGAQDASIAGTDVADMADFEILSDLQNGVQGLTELPFKHIIKTFEIPTSLKGAYCLLLSDSSTFTETVHLANQDGSKATVGKWRPSARAEEPTPSQAGTSTSTTAGGRSREITFVQRIDNPLSPIKQGRGFWYQRVGWLASGVLCYQTYSALKDVPFCDSWAIQKKWIIRPAGECGLDSTVCQVTCSIECVFHRKLLWSGKLESETISQATKDYRQLADKIVLFLRAADPQAAGRAAPPPPRALRDNETEIEMLRRRLAECEGLLRAGAAVRVSAGGVLGGLMGKAAPDFHVRARHSAETDKWTWAATDVHGAELKEGKGRVAVWAASGTAPSA